MAIMSSVGFCLSDTFVDKENLKKQLVDLEQKLIHATINVSQHLDGWLPGSKADGDSNQLPTIAIVAAPALSVGSDSNVSWHFLKSLDYFLFYTPTLTQEEGQTGLWLHVSKPLENAYAKQIFEGLSNVAEEFGVPWEHEQFSRLRVTAATLSRHSGEFSESMQFLLSR
ncbi:nicalin-1 isoform X2 [Tanacetum coccineum]